MRIPVHKSDLLIFNFPISRNNYGALLRCLEEVKEKFHNGTADQKKKCQTADGIQSNMYNMKFALSLSVLCDIYKVYGTCSNLLQVHTLINYFKIK